ncbi:MAG: UbiA family prenyltransferase [Parcubacteria group bacterium]|nr:UbiA family prenyltransferase [Parcubacteria group bacterium]
MQIKTFIKKLEGTKLSFWQFLIALVSIAALRIFAETFSDLDNRWQILPPDSFIHYCLWFILTFLTISLVLVIATREKVVTVLKMQIMFFPIILLAPFIDLIVSSGLGANIAYIMGRDMAELGRMFLTYFGSLDNFEISIGMRLELVLACFFAAYYVYLKRGKVWPTVLAPFLVYTIAFVYLALPNIILPLGDLEYDDKLFSFLILVLTLLSLLVLFLLYSRQKFIACWKNARPYRIVHYQAMLLGGLLLGKVLLGYEIVGWQLAAAMIALLLAWLAQVGLNDLSDTRIDAISNQDRPLIKKTLTVPEYKIITVILTLLALLLAYTVSYYYLIFIAVFMIIYTIYSWPPLRLKRVPVLSIFLIAGAALVILMAGFSLPDHKYLTSLPPYTIALILIAFSLAAHVKDVKDIAGDKAAGILTIPTMLGARAGKKVVGILVGISYLSVVLIIPRFFGWLLLVAIIGGVINYWLINRKNYQEKYVFITYFIFLVILIYYLGKIYI